MRREFPVSSAGLSAAFDFVAEAVGGDGAGGADGHGAAVAQRISVVLDEVCANMIRHDDSLTEAERFAVELHPGADETVLVISDPGQPFNPLEPRRGPAPDIGGHGLALIRGLSSSQHYERVDGWNRLTLSIPASIPANR